MLGNLLDSSLVKEIILSVEKLNKEEKESSISILEGSGVFEEDGIMSFTLKMKLAKLFPVIGREKVLLISKLIDEKIEYLLLKQDEASVST